MSIPVDLAALEAEISRFGPLALLVTTSADASAPDAAAPHVASVIVTIADGALAMGAGKRTRANAAAHRAVALVWSAGAGSDYCLIVDGVAEEPIAETLVVRPTSAVLHRVASAPADIARCLPLDADA